MEQEAASVNSTLKAHLSSPDEEIRRLAVSSLAGYPLPVVKGLLYAAMGDESWRVRKEALDVLFKLNLDDVAIEEMVGLLRSSENAGLRNSACEALEKLGDRSVPVLSRYIEDEDCDVRKFIIDVLGNIGSSEPVPLLIKALQDADTNVSSSAAENLGKIGDERAVPALVAMLDRTNIPLCYTVLEALGRIGMPVPLDAVMALNDEPLLRKPVIDCLGAVKDIGAIPLLISGLHEKARHVRAAAASTILMIRDALKNDDDRGKVDSSLRALANTSFSGELISSLAESDKQLSEQMARILGYIGDPRASLLLLDGCRDDRLRRTCLNSIQETGAEGYRSIIGAYDSADEEQRCYIAYVCGELGLRESAPVISRGMRDPSHVIRRVSAIAAGNIGDPSVISILDALLDDDEFDVRTAAVDSLARLTPLDRPAVNTIAGRLASAEHAEKRRSAATLFAALGDSERLAWLIKDENVQVRKAAVFALAELKSETSVNNLVMALVDEEPDVRMAAAGALGSLGGEQAVTSLLVALNDSNQWVRCAALRSLGMLQVAEAVPAIDEMVQSAEGLVLIEALRTLFRICRERGKQSALKALDHRDKEVVKASIEILTEIDGNWIDEQAERLLAHEQWDIRSLCIKAIAEYRRRNLVPLLTTALEKETDDLVKRQIQNALDELS